MWYDRFIEMVPGVQGGEPVIRGTRTPIRTIVGYAQASRGNIDGARDALPHLTAEEIEAALAYYQDHPSEIDRHIERHREALKQVRTA